MTEHTHTHTYQYETVSLTGALRCNRCAAYVSGAADDIELHNQLHDQLEALALNGEPGLSSKKPKPKKAKKS